MFVEALGALGCFAVEDLVPEPVVVPGDGPEVHRPLPGFGRVAGSLRALHLDEFPHLGRYREQAVGQLLGWFALEVRGGVVHREGQHGGRPPSGQYTRLQALSDRPGVAWLTRGRSQTDAGNTESRITLGVADRGAQVCDETVPRLTTMS